jgi:NADPH-dependent 2,4-dienoyl-CoA reductase/sulfur reductase-like enzyme
MAAQGYKYVIVGGGLAGASAVEGIREQDKDGSILLIGTETALPYNRPPLTKGLWTGDEKVDDIFVHDEAFYNENNVEPWLGATVQSVDPARRTVTLNGRETIAYEKLLLATGGAPRHLDISGADLPGISYYRRLGDFESLRADVKEGKTAVVVGGGFIGSEIAAALTLNGVKVTMVFPGEYLVNRIFPEDLGRAIQKEYEGKGITVLHDDVPVSIEKQGEKFITATREGKRLESDLLVVGIGIKPGVELARNAGLDTENGITVDERLQTSDPNIYAAGDNANFPYASLQKRTRVEHWDNAVNQGKQAGRNMAGAGEPYTYMPFFFSDLFDFGYEAVGELDSRLEVFADWEEPFKTGVLYYLKDQRLRGAMMCNVWDKVPDARELIRAGKPVTPDDLRGKIKSDG